MRTISTTNGTPIKVDDEWYAPLARFRWSLTAGYASRRQNGKTVYMHRIIAGTPTGMLTDHINGDTRDNQSANLRICSRRQNQQNLRTPSHNTSGHKGVSRDNSRGKWTSKIQDNGKSIFLGRFDRVEDAARAYEEAARRLFGEFRRQTTPALSLHSARE